MRNFHLSRSDTCIKHCIAHVTMPDLFPLDHRHVEGFSAVGSYKPHVNRMRSLKLHFQYLVEHAGELSVILIVGTPNQPPYEPMQRSAPDLLWLDTASD